MSILRPHRWNYNWNLARKNVDSAHPGIVESEYIEHVPEEMFTSTPVNEQAAYDVTLEWCKRNFELVVGNSFGFMSAQIAASNVSECAYWVDETTGVVDKSVPYPTRILHAGGYIQTPSMATMFTKVG